MISKVVVQPRRVAPTDARRPSWRTEGRETGRQAEPQRGDEAAKLPANPAIHSAPGHHPKAPQLAKMNQYVAAIDLGPAGCLPASELWVSNDLSHEASA